MRTDRAPSHHSLPHTCSSWPWARKLPTRVSIERVHLQDGKLSGQLYSCLRYNLVALTIQFLIPSFPSSLLDENEIRYATPRKLHGKYAPESIRRTSRQRSSPSDNASPRGGDIDTQRDSGRQRDITVSSVSPCSRPTRRLKTVRGARLRVRSL